MNDIENRFFNIINNNFSQQNEREAFAICPRVFYDKLSSSEIDAMIQLYRTAYEKAKFQTKSKFDIFYN
ncbi:hypothetical protein ACSVC9_07820 [Clostridium sp. LBM24168]